MILKKLLIILGAVLLFVFLLLLIGWFMKIRRIDHYLTKKYNEKFELQYSFKDYLDNFQLQYLKIHWSDNGWWYKVIVTPVARPELKFTCFLGEGAGSYYDTYTYKCLGAELKPHVVSTLPRDSGDYLVDVHVELCNLVELLDTRYTFRELQEIYAKDSAAVSSFPSVFISVVYKLEGRQGIDNILDRCIRLVKDKTFGPRIKLKCYFVPAEEYQYLKNKQERLPEFFYHYMWEREFPVFYIYSGQTEETLQERKEKTLRRYQQYKG